MAKVIFNKKQSIKKYVIKSKKATLKNMGPKLLKSVKIKSNHFGMYPVPTGRILERYAFKHNLSPVLPAAKNLLSNTKLIGFDDELNKSKSKMALTYHEAVKRYPNMCPCKDSDGDGVVNMADCRPFNKKKQDDEFDKYGNTLPGKEYRQKDNQKFIPIKNAKQTVEVKARDLKIESIGPKRPKFK